MRTKRSFPALLPAMLGALLLLGSAAAQQQQLFLLDGQVVEGTLQEVRDDRLMWQETDSPGSMTIPLASVDYVGFPNPDQWTGLMEAFMNRDFELAIEIKK